MADLFGALLANQPQSYAELSGQAGLHQALANALMQSALSPGPSGQMVSGHWVPTYSGLASIPKAYLSNQARQQGYTEQNQINQMLGKTLQGMNGTSAQPGVPSGTPGQYSIGTSVPGIPGTSSTGINPASLALMSQLSPDYAKLMVANATLTPAQKENLQARNDSGYLPTLQAINENQAAGKQHGTAEWTGVTVTDPNTGKSKVISTANELGGTQQGGGQGGYPVQSPTDLAHSQAVLKAKQDAATFESMQQPILANIKMMHDLVPKLPGSKLTGVYTKAEEASPMFGQQYAGAKAQWDKLNQQLIQFATRIQTAAGGASNAETSHSIVEGNGIPFDAPDSVKYATLKALQTEAINVDSAMKNKVHQMMNLTPGSTQQPMVTNLDQSPPQKPPQVDYNTWPLHRGSDGHVYRVNPQNPRQGILVQ